MLEEAFREDSNEKFSRQLGQNIEAREVSVKANIKWKGFEYLTTELRKDQQDAISLALKRNSTVQMTTAKVVAAFAAISMLASTGTLISKLTDTSPESTIPALQDLRTELDRLSKYQKGIDLSLQKAVKDSFYIRSYKNH